MKVICIDAKQKTRILHHLIEGNTYTVTSSYEDKVSILEHPKTDCGMDAVFSSNRFINTSNIDETELVKQRENNLQDA